MGRRRVIIGACILACAGYLLTGSQAHMVERNKQDTFRELWLKQKERNYTPELRKDMHEFVRRDITLSSEVRQSYLEHCLQHTSTKENAEIRTRLNSQWAQDQWSSLRSNIDALMGMTPPHIQAASLRQEQKQSLYERLHAYVRER